MNSLLARCIRTNTCCITLLAAILLLGGFVTIYSYSLQLPELAYSTTKGGESQNGDIGGGSEGPLPPTSSPDAQEQEQEVCDDGIDNDHDGLVDLEDKEDCPPSPIADTDNTILPPSAGTLSEQQVQKQQREQQHKEVPGILQQPQAQQQLPPPSKIPFEQAAQIGLGEGEKTVQGVNKTQMPQQPIPPQLLSVPPVMNQTVPVEVVQYCVKLVSFVINPRTVIGGANVVDGNIVVSADPTTRQGSIGCDLVINSDEERSITVGFNISPSNGIIHTIPNIVIPLTESQSPPGKRGIADISDTFSRGFEINTSEAKEASNAYIISAVLGSKTLQTDLRVLPAIFCVKLTSFSLPSPVVGGNTSKVL